MNKEKKVLTKEEMKLQNKSIEKFKNNERTNLEEIFEGDGLDREEYYNKYDSRYNANTDPFSDFFDRN